MKKILVLLLLLLLSGCTLVRIDTENIDTTVNVVLSKNNELFNQIGKGYKYYVPRDVNYIESNGLNDKLYSNGNYYYLYIDIISYYYNKQVDYTVDEKAFYSKKININNKIGYLEINEIEGNYFIEFMYNYAKIEALVAFEDIKLVVLNSSYILSTIKFNDNVIRIMLNDDYFTSVEQKYDIFTSKQSTNKFLQYVEEESEE